MLPPKGSKGGASLREHLRAVERSTGRRDRRLNEPKLLPGSARVWTAFWELYEGKPITFSELRAWADLMDEALTPWESETLRMMSLVAVREASDGGLC